MKHFLGYLLEKSIKKPFLANLSLAIGLFYPMIGSAILIQNLPNYRIVDNDVLKRGNLTLIREQGIDYQYQSVFSDGQLYYVGKLKITLTKIIMHKSLILVKNLIICGYWCCMIQKMQDLIVGYNG